MGSCQSRQEFDPDRTTKQATLPSERYNKLVIFGENTENQVSFLLSPVPKHGGQEAFSIDLEIKFEEDRGRPVLGFALNKVNVSSIRTLVKNEHFYVWEVSKGTIVNKSKQVTKDRLPALENGGRLSVKFVPATAKLFVTVNNPGKPPESKEIVIRGTLPVTDLWPFVGAVYTGLEKVSFTILESSTTIHNNNDLTDLSFKVMFNSLSSHGTINVSKDLKRVSRESTQQGNGCALLPVKMSSGIHRWTFKVWCDFGCSLCFGLARYPFRLSEEYARDSMKHIYRHPGLLLYRSYRGLLYRDGKQLDKTLDSLDWQHNKPVIMELVFDANKGSLELIKNERSIGFAFEKLQGIFQPVVCFYAAYEKDVELKQYLTTEASLDITVQSPGNSLETGSIDKKAMVTDESISFDKRQRYGKFNMSPDGKAIFREKSQTGNSFCFLDVVCRKYGVYRFSFIIEFDHGASTCLGVTTVMNAEKVHLGKIGNIYTSESFYMYRSFQGMLFVKGKEQKKRLEEFWMSGSLVLMEIRITEKGGSVRFDVNGMDQGVAFSGLQTPLRPLVAFYAGMEKRITILHYEFAPMKRESETLTATTTKSVASPTSSFQATSTTPKSLIARDGDSGGLNDLTIEVLKEEPDLPLPILCSASDAEIYCSSCMKCQATTNVITLPCKHSTLCSRDITVGLNAPTRRCVTCDQKVTQLWNILVTKPHK